MAISFKYWGRGLTRVLLVTICVGLFTLQYKQRASQARQVPPKPAHAGGLITPSASERKTEEQLVPVENEVTLNALALARINSDRKAKGLPPLPAKATAPGHEINSMNPATNSPPAAPSH